MDSSREERDEETSELDAAEAVTSGTSPAPPPKAEVMCPNCGHPVEAGFKFCDWCGRPLAAAPVSDAKPAVPEVRTPPPSPTSAPPSTTAPPHVATPRPSPTPAPAPPRPVPAPPPNIPPPPVREAPKPEPKPVSPGPKLPDAPTRPVPAPPPNNLPAARTATPPRPVPTTAELRPVSRPVDERPFAAEPPSRAVPTFLIHLVAAFAAGAVVLAIVAVVVTLATSGRVALLESKGIPTAIAVASGVALFAAFRTARRGGWVAWTAAAVGLLVLAGAGAYLYRPVYPQNAQVRLERALRVWSDRDATAVDDFRGDLVSWNGTVAEYQRDVAAVVNKHITPQDFRSVAGPALQSLQETTVSMQTHSTSARNEKLRDALATLAGVYNDQLTGLRLVSSGILTNDFNSLGAGDQQYKDARKRAGTVFSEQIRPLLERAGIDPVTFEQALAQ